MKGNIQDSFSNSYSPSNEYEFESSEPASACSDTNNYSFNIRFLGKKKVLEQKNYTSVELLKADAFAHFEEYNLDDDNAILTYFDNNNDECKLVTNMEDIRNNGRYKKLIIQCIQLACGMCDNPFSIIENQLPFECPRQSCGQQYCKNCVTVIQGPAPVRPFICIKCTKKVIPTRNLLIEKHLLWKGMCKRYGTESLENPTSEKHLISPTALSRDINIRRIHLQLWLDNLQLALNKRNSIDYLDQQIIEDVRDLCDDLNGLLLQLKENSEVMEKHAVTVADCVEKYQKSLKQFDICCHSIIKSIEAMATENCEISEKLFDDDKKHIEEKYRMNNLSMLRPIENVTTINSIFEDLHFRQSHLESQLMVYESLSTEKPRSDADCHKYIKEAQKMLQKMTKIKKDLDNLRNYLQVVERCFEKYDKCLRDENFKDINCSKFILYLEKMRTRTEYLEVKANFHNLSELCERWQNTYETNGLFQPKVINLFQAIENDLENLFQNKNHIYSLSYKIGIIGDGSIGKTALLLKLANIKNATSDLVDIIRSTYNYVPINTSCYEHPNNKKIIPITFVDLQGAIDTKNIKSIESYIELITQANCDLYLLVFDKPFNDHNRCCQKHIENELKRKCLLVWTKTDSLLSAFTRQNLIDENGKISLSDYNLRTELRNVREHVLMASNRQRLSQRIYLTAAGCDSRLKNNPFFAFDLKELQNELIQLAIKDTRLQRIWTVAFNALNITINTCFRLGYVVSQTHHQWIAAGCSVVPFLEIIPAFFAQEKIRQEFGIHDRLTIENRLGQTSNSFECYLTEKNFAVPAKYLTSSCFQYLKPTETNRLNENQDTALEENSKLEHLLSSNAKGHTLRNTLNSVAQGTATTVARTITGFSIAGKLLDDVLMIAVPSSAAALRVASLAGIIVSVVTVPLFAAWAFYSTKKRMTTHLHELCDDLFVILVYFVVKLSSMYCETEELRCNSSSEVSLSSDDEETN